MRIVKKMDDGSYMGGYIRGYRNGKAYIKWTSYYEGEHAKIIDLLMEKKR